MDKTDQLQKLRNALHAVIDELGEHLLRVVLSFIEELRRE